MMQTSVPKTSAAEAKPTALWQPAGLETGHFDVIVVGGGHAGVEAAAAAARMGASVALVTLDAATIGAMSCNPAVGGIGKGHLVREIDALDGLIARAADAAGIHFRLLNRSRGPAVQGPRAQCDRQLFARAIQSLMRDQPGLTLLQGEVACLLRASPNGVGVPDPATPGRVVGLMLTDGRQFGAASIVLTTGTFLAGRIHQGAAHWPAGRVGEPPANTLAAWLRGTGLLMGRLKTGTPPRLDGRTIAWNRLEAQPGDAEPVFLSSFTQSAAARQVPCAITHTTDATAAFMRAHLGATALYGGHLADRGPRYCPSLEDKIVRFPDRTAHQIFLEPEGLSTHWVYPNGLSTSLAAEAQQALVQTLPGLEAAQILRPGYAIAYDRIDPRALTPGLAVAGIPSLFLAGQINGTTGYEEAAGQGLLAGISAAHHAAGRSTISFGRDQALIGVMVDDLTRHGADEPYRMFTSRAEHRLHLRIDNADERLTALGIDWGCISGERLAQWHRTAAALGEARQILEQTWLAPTQLAAAGLAVRQDGVKRSAFAWLRQDGFDDRMLAHLVPAAAAVPTPILARLRIDSLYAVYGERATRERSMASTRGGASLRGTDWTAVPGLAHEMADRLHRLQPATLAEAAAIPGMTPAALERLAALARHRPGDASLPSSTNEAAAA